MQGPPAGARTTRTEKELGGVAAKTPEQTTFTICPAGTLVDIGQVGAVLKPPGGFDTRVTLTCPSIIPVLDSDTVKVTGAPATNWGGFDVRFTQRITADFRSTEQGAPVTCVQCGGAGGTAAGESVELTVTVAGGLFENTPRNVVLMLRFAGTRTLDKGLTIIEPGGFATDAMSTLPATGPVLRRVIVNVTWPSGETQSGLAVSATQSTTAVWSVTQHGVPMTRVH